MPIAVINKLSTSDAVDLDLDTFAEAVDAGEVAVVDVREPHEFAAGHIPGSVNLPLSRFHPRDLPAPADKTVVIVCQAGVRSRKALNQAQATGRADLKHYPGGMAQWRAHGRTVTAQ
jgi:rhodanese-related sulfurtransferase